MNLDPAISGHAQSQVPSWAFAVLLLAAVVFVLGLVDASRGPKPREPAEPASPPSDVPAARVVKRR